MSYAADTLRWPVPPMLVKLGLAKAEEVPGASDHWRGAFLDETSDQLLGLPPRSAYCKLIERKGSRRRGGIKEADPGNLYGWKTEKRFTGVAEFI